MSLRQGSKSIAETHSYLIEEWIDKRDIWTVSAGMAYRAEWVCLTNENHTYKAAIYSRTGKQKSGCPYCSNKKVLAGDNDLATLRKDLLKEWDDKDILPTEVTIKSGKSVWWKCNKSHRWKTVVKNRVNCDSGCPYCSGRLPIVGETDLKTTDPLVLDEWDYENNTRTPIEVSRGSNYKAHWKCHIGHSYQMMVVAKIRGRGCPYCSGSIVLVGETDLATTHPELLEEWSSNNIKLPTQVTAGSTLRVEWICKEKAQHVWVCSVQNRARRRNPSGCPKCSKNTSKAEEEIEKYIRSLGFQTCKDRKILNGKEIDIYIECLKIGFEYNGDYWHSDKYIQKAKGVTSKEYHKGKKGSAKKRGIDLYFIWEEDWNKDKETIKALIVNILHKKIVRAPLLEQLTSPKEKVSSDSMILQ